MTANTAETLSLTWKTSSIRHGNKPPLARLFKLRGRTVPWLSKSRRRLVQRRINDAHQRTASQERCDGGSVGFPHAA